MHLTLTILFTQGIQLNAGCLCFRKLTQDPIKTYDLEADNFNLDIVLPKGIVDDHTMVHVLVLMLYDMLFVLTTAYFCHRGIESRRTSRKTNHLNERRPLLQRQR